MKYKLIKNIIGNEFEEGGNGKLDVYSPIDGSIISQVSLSSSESVNRAVQQAKKALTGWSATPIKERAQVFYKYKRLLEENINELSQIVAEENGKTLAEARSEVEKSAELTEFACSMPVNRLR